MGAAVEYPGECCRTTDAGFGDYSRAVDSLPRLAAATSVRCPLTAPDEVRGAFHHSINAAGDTR